MKTKVAYFFKEVFLHIRQNWLYKLSKTILLTNQVVCCDQVETAASIKFLAFADQQTVIRYF